jgi:hypothetical protein
VLYAMGLTVHPLTGRFAPRLDWLPIGVNGGSEEGREGVSLAWAEPVVGDKETASLARVEPMVRVVPVARRIVRRANGPGS